MIRPRGQAPPALELPRLFEFLRIPSVSSDPRRADDVRRCAEWLANHLKRIGLPFVRVVKTAKYPIVYAEWIRAPGRPTVLLYGHYDVQPAGPASKWTTPPFEPTIRNGAIYARGAADDKGPVFAILSALAAWLRRGGPPVNVKLLIEGEEEIGSPNLAAFIRRHKRRLASTVAVVADTPMAAGERPAVVYGLRGMLRVRLDVRGPKSDLHSGLYGGAIRSPTHVLADLLTQLHDSDGRVAIPGFYEGVEPVAASERRRLKADGPGNAELLRAAGAAVGYGEPNFTAYERTVIRPAVVVTGLAGSDTGLGGAAVVPARAGATIDIRLVRAQDPDRIAAAFRRFVAARVPPAAVIGVRTSGGSRAVVVDPSGPAMRAAATALRAAFGVRPALLRCGGTIPVVGLLSELLGTPTVLLGLTRPNDGQHGPDERYHLADLRRGADSVFRFLALAATLPRRTPP